MSSSSTYKLIYFDKRGLGELTRLVLTVAGQPFDDVRLKLSDKEEFLTDRDIMSKPAGPGPGHYAVPIGAAPPAWTVPVLEVDGQQIAQSGAIVRFLSHRFGLMGSNDIEAALIDAFYEANKDLVRTAQSSFTDKEKLAQFWASGLPEGLAQLEKNVRGSLWISASNTLSFAELALYCALFIFDSQSHDAVQKALDANPKIKAIWEAVPKIERIAAYLEKRPVTAW